MGHLKTSILLPAAVLVVVFVLKAEAIKCFQCSSSNNPGCADLMSNDTSSPYYQNCTAIKTRFCRKTVHTILDSNRLVRITRDCGWETFKGDVDNCYENDDDFKYEKSCQCFTDGCNSATTMQISALALLFSSMFLFYRNV